ncbi:MAG: HEAT repeat domain-containing protein [Bdellovibrionota bacterium]
MKSSWISEYGQKKFEFVRINNERIFGSFQASFYFYYEEQFKPSVEEFLRADPHLTQILVVSSNGQVVFDSKDLPRGKTQPYKVDPELGRKLQKMQVLSDPSGIGVVMPADQYVLYYVFSTGHITLRTLLVFLAGMAIVVLLWFALTYARLPAFLPLWSRFSALFRVYSLRAKFVATIIVINLLTGAIVFFSQSHLQKNEQTERLIRNSVQIAELSKDFIVSSFSNFYYFYYNDKFVPTVKQAISSKENLNSIRIISKKSGMIVFDSEDIALGKQPVPGVEGKKADFTEEVTTKLSGQDTYWKVIKSGAGESLIQVVTTYRSENQEAPFYVEFLFSFASLKDRIQVIQRQILLDLIPSMILSIIIAILFAQLVVGPVRKLVDATQAITSGNYDVTVETGKRDELGDLMRSFNGMARELKRKNELKKYLSENTYRRITEAPEGVSNLAGARVRATVLFCDIRNFVNVCELLDAEEVTSMLNEYFSAMVEVIYKHKGEVDKFIGDAILAVFYEQDELKQPVNTALHAIYCAMEMRERLSEFNVKRLRNDKSVIEIGIGISSGEIISGPIGSPDRMDFTVIGDVVNLANRIEKLSKQGRHTRIVFSHHVEERVQGLLDYEELSRDKIRGKEEEVIVYELIKIKDVSELLVNLSNPDPMIKRHCIELLGYSSNVEALEPLYQKLSDSNEMVRTATISAITRLAPRGHSETLEILFQQLEHETSDKVISSILISLGKLCRDEKILRVTRFLHHPDERIVANAIESLSGSEDPQIIDLLIPFVASKSNRVKANAAMVLFSKGRVEVLDTLKPMLLHSDHGMRASAAFAIGELTLLATSEGIAIRIKDDPRRAKHFLAELQGCVPLLVSLLKDPELTVKKQAIIALGKIKDKSAVLPLLDNVNTESDSKELMHELAEALRSIGSHRLVREVIRQLT